MAQMETCVVRDVTGKSFDIFILKNLSYLFDQYLNIRETKYLVNFSKLKTQQTFNPKFIIGDMLITYICNVVDIYHQPDLFRNFIFTFHEEDEDVCTFTFSNNMMFKDDITTICFLWCIRNRHTHNSDQSEIVQILKSVMFNKYGICVETEADNADPKKLTLNYIAFAFPSITWDIIYDHGMLTGFFDNFSDFDLPEMIFAPDIFVLLPHLKKTPIAILIIVILRLYKKRNNPDMYEKLSLQDIYNNIKFNLSYKNKRFPERFKLELCEKWQIIILENGIYKYNSNFEAHRQKAKDIIAKMKPDDPNLERILSKI